MATCNQSLAAMVSYAALDEIIPNTLTPFSVNGSTNKLFRLSCPTVQSVQFTFVISTLPANLSITFFTWNGSSAAPVGGISVTSANVTTLVDLQAGDYIVCVRSVSGNTQTGTLLGAFTGYAQQIRFVPSAHTGESASIVFADPPRPPQQCDEALYFEIIDGLLPPGLHMDALGVVRGTLPNLDCLMDRSNPSINWFYEENDGSAWPWGREWRFQARVWVDGLKESSKDEEWFCIRIHNNWTFDQERFLALSEYENITAIRVFEPPAKLKDVCLPCAQVSPNAPIFVPQKLPDPAVACEPCEHKNRPTTVELIPIPVELCECIKPETVIEWAQSNTASSNNPNIEKFKENLASSEAFKILMNRAGVDTQKDVVFVQQFDNFLQLILVDTTDDIQPSYADLIDDWQETSNQLMPTITMMAHEGETCSLVL